MFLLRLVLQFPLGFFIFFYFFLFFFFGFFYRNGFTESINVSLFGLAISDLLALLFLVPFAAFINPYSLYSDDINWNAMDFGYVIVGKY